MLALATGDVGARPYLQAHPDRVTAVECGDIGRPDDVDTPEDLARVSRALPAAGCGRVRWPRTARRRPGLPAPG